MSDQSTKNGSILKIAAVLFIIWGILGLMDAKNYSYDGYNTDGNNTIVQVKEGSPAEAAGMQVGDVMKSYDGILVSDSKAFSKRGRTEIGQTVEIVVDRNGEEQALQVTYTALPDMNTTLNMSAFILGLLFIVLGLYVDHKKKTALSFAFAVFAVFFGFVFFNGPYMNPGFLRELVNSIDITLIMFAFVALARFILQYPPQSSFLNGGNSRWIYAPAAVIVVIIWVLNFVQPDSTSTLNVTIRTLFGVIIIFYFGLALITLIRKYSNANAENRKSLGLNHMLLGAVLGLLPFLIFFTVNQLSPTTILPGDDYMFLTFAFIPIFFSMALFQKN
jgi:mannose/fructose/N-acetylgalactosamine-specific phosphotransferase system component IIC